MMVSIPLSHFVMGLSGFILLLNWIAEWNWQEKRARIRQNWQGLFFSGLFVAFLVGLLKTQDWATAGHVLLAQLPILFAPIIVISSRQLSLRAVRWMLRSFIWATFFGAVCSIVYWLTHSINDIREISIFIDHIRFSLCIVLSVVFCMWFAIKQVDMAIWVRVIYAVLVTLFVGYLFVAQTLTGLVVLFVIALFYACYLLFKIPNHGLKWTIFSLLALLLVGFVAYTTYITYEYFHNEDTMIMAKRTEMGNRYSFDVESLVENGHRIDYYVCKSELEMAWKERSTVEYDELLEQTLIRYLNSKGLRKDYAAVMSLSAEDISHVEGHIANYDYTRSFGLRRALYPTFFSYTMYMKCGYIDNSSLLQRVELWSASWSVLKDNWFLGVGLGDNKAALDAQLERQQSSIAYKHNRGSHNQFLTLWMMGGLILLGYFLFVLVYPFVGLKKRVTFVYVAFTIVLVLSMFVEDTISAQTGRMLFAVVNPLLLYALGSIDGHDNHQQTSVNS